MFKCTQAELFYPLPPTFNEQRFNIFSLVSLLEALSCLFSSVLFAKAYDVVLQQRGPFYQNKATKIKIEVEKNL